MTHTVDDVLMTSETWSDYQALQQIETQLWTSLAELDHEQRQRYLKLCRVEPQAKQDLAEAIQNFKGSFETNACNELAALFHERTGYTLNLYNTYLHTRVFEIPQRKDAKDPIELLSTLFSSRTKRALADTEPREHVITTTLWQAAKDNFAFHLSSRLHSGLDFQRASALNTSANGELEHTFENLQVAQCVDIIREFDMASRLRSALQSHLATTLNPLIFTHQKVSFELALLEALRSSRFTGEALQQSARLMAALAEERALNWHFFHLQFGWQLLSSADKLDLPFCVMALPDSNGVFSYFANRPQGALRYHQNVSDAISSLREHIRTDAKANRIGWLVRTLSLADQAILLRELKTTAVDENQLNWLAKQLYQVFNNAGPAAERIDIRCERRHPKPPVPSLLSALEKRQGQTLSQDLQSIAMSSASKDWQQIKNTLLYIGSEIIELLTLPAPGGVTGLNRLMIIASLGTLTYTTVSAGEALARGESADFVQALGDIAELIISSRIQGVGARLSARRSRQLINALGNPRVTELPNGDRSLSLAEQHHGHGPLAQVDVSNLTSTELLQTMLRPDMPSLSHQDAQYLQALTKVERIQLEAAWNGDAPIPWTLEFAIRDLHLQRIEAPRGVMEQGNHSTTTALRLRFKHLPETAAQDLVRQYPTLKNIHRQTTLEPEQRAAIDKAQVQSRLIRVFNILNDENGRGLDADAEAIACHLLTVQGRWPADLCIQVYQGAENYSGSFTKTQKLLATYGNDSATSAVMLLRVNQRYAGYDQTNDDVLQPRDTDYPLTSALLRTLTDAQRDHLKYQLYDGRKLATAILSEAHIHSSMIGDLLPTPTTFDLSAERLAAFQLVHDYSTANVDSNGLYSDGGKLYARIDSDFFQVMHDRDASSPSRKVMRIVRPGDAIASDSDNLYVASRNGRSEPITLDAERLWVGAVTALSGGGPKVDRLNAMREKTLAERQQYISYELAMQQAVAQFNMHLAQPATSTYFILAGSDYYQLKQITCENACFQVLRHRKAATTDFESLPPSVPQKREALTRSVIELENIDRSYQRVCDFYESISALELNAMKSVDVDDLLLESDAPLFQPMQEANANMIALLDRFRALVHDEIDRLLVKLDELPMAPASQTRSKPAPGKKKAPIKASVRLPQPTTLPKNRVEIYTKDGTVLSGKPRSNNPNIVDVLDSRGQRKATYLRSSDGQYWIAHVAAQIPSADSPATAPAWASHEATVQKLLSEALHSESVADYLGRKKHSAPAAPEGLLEYQANRLEEHAKDIDDITAQLANVEDRQQALDKSKVLREKAEYLRQKGRSLRIDLIIANNAPVGNDLQYLAESNNLSVRKTRAARIPMDSAGTSKAQPPRDYIDEFELKIKDRDQIWAYAHLHYAEQASDAPAFRAAHLKRPEQRFQGAQLQTQQAQSGRRYEIHRGELRSGHVQEILLSGRFN